MQKKGDVWVSSVLYILISLAVLSLVLVSVQPIINKNRDKTAVLQSQEILKEIDSTIQDVTNAQGTTLNIDVKLSRGYLTINSSLDEVSWQLQDSAYQYSQENRTINITNDGKLKAITTKQGKNWNTKLWLEYNKYNITYSGQETTRVLTEGEYQVTIRNANNTMPTQIDFFAS